MQTMIIVDHLEFDDLVDINIEDLYIIIDAKNKIEFRSWLWKNHSDMQSNNILDNFVFGNRLPDALARAVYWYLQRIKDPFNAWWEGKMDENPATIGWYQVDIDPECSLPVLILKDYSIGSIDIDSIDQNLSGAIIKKDNKEVGYYLNNRLWLCRAVEHMVDLKQTEYNMLDIFNNLKTGITDHAGRVYPPMDYCEIII